jgi:2-haloacid dehalogenase
VYELAMREVGTSNKEKVLFVSANDSDVAGSKAFGFRSVWVNRGGIKARFDSSLDFSPDYCIANMAELAKLL